MTLSLRNKKVFIWVAAFIFLVILAIILIGVRWRTASSIQAPSPAGSAPAHSVDVQDVLRQATLAMNQADYDFAIQILKEALQKQPQNLDLMLQLGRVYRKAKNFAQADALYEEAFSKYPQCKECLNNRAVNLIEAENPVRAVQFLQQAISQSPSYLEAHLNLGLAYEKNGQAQLAVEAYQKYLKLTPSNDSRPEPAMARERIRRLQEGL